MPIFGDADDLTATDAATLAPISMARIASALETLEINYGTDDDGDFIAGFDGNPMWFQVTGPTNEPIAFSANARWKATLPADEIDVALRLVNEWNSTQMFPRALCVEDEGGEVVFGADYTCDYEFGVTDLQLRNDITIAVTTAINLFESLEERFPEAVEAFEAELQNGPDA